MRNSKYKIIFYLGIVLTLIFNITYPHALAEGNQYQSENKILYINAKIEFNPGNNSYSAALADQKISSGRLKDDKSFTGQIHNTELKLTFLDSYKEIIKIKKVENPLIKQIENVGGNMSTLESSLITENSGSFQVRTTYNSNIKYLKIEMLNKSGQLIEVGLLNIESINSKNIIPNTAGSGFEVVKILDNGPDEQKINLVIMGDGFTANEQDKFINEAKKLGNYILANEAYASNKYKFNIYAIKAISNVSGAADDPSNLIDNYFGSTYNYYGIRRLLVPTRNDRIFNTLATYTPQYDQALILVNADEYGGSGGAVATSSINVQAPEIIVHEMGHSFAGLSDEYWAGDMYARENINFTQNNNPATVKWKSFLGVNGVGIYKVEPDLTWYIPHQNCKMRYLGADFCAVCLNAHKNRINELAPTVIKEDVNKDGSVDISDLALVAQAYNIKAGNTKWNALLDIKADNEIDIFDIVLVAKAI